MQSIILASKSPRRQELIRRITDDVEVIVSKVDETIPPDVTPEEAPRYLAVIKAAAVAEKHRDKLVIGADTVVILDGQLMGKPRDKDDAVRMLSALSGNVHTVITGCCITCGNRIRAFSEVTKVEFYPLSDEDIEEYIATGEPFDKAGAYGIQDKGSLFVKGIEGDFFNVMGLPVGRLNSELREFLSAEDD